MLRKLAVVVSIFILAPIALRAQSPFTICNSLVEADVSNNGAGLVTIFYGPCGTHANGIVHSSQTSFLTVLINDSFYTNNFDIQAHSPDNTPPNTPAAILNNGITKFTGPNKDTIETTWEPEGPNTFEIIQDIFLESFPIVASGQVVYKFRVLNLQNTPLSAQAQYLADLDVGGNDASPVTTRFGMLSTQPTIFPNVNNPDIPPYFITTQESINSADFPGLMAEGYMNDSLAPEPMGLIQPLLFAYVQWPDVVPAQTWGVPTTTQTVNDGALLFQWPELGVNSGQTVEIGSFSYGTAACSNQICFGNLDAIMLHPEHIVWNGANYSPNPFPVEAVVWNQNLQAATGATGTQSITSANTGLADGPIKIAFPLPDTINGFMQIHDLSNRGTVPAEMSSSITWEDTVLGGVLTNCADSIYSIAFSVAASGVGATNCQNGIYICPIEVDCQERPRITPTTTVLNRTGSYDGSICNMRCTEVVAFDTGAIRIPVLLVSADTLTNMRLTIAPNHVGADSTFYTICVVDSMLNGSAEITVTDSLGNSSIEQYTYCTIADTHAPQVQQLICIDSNSCTWEVSDTQAWDRGLDTIYFTNNTTIIPPTNVHGLGVVEFQASEGASFCITAIDLAGNKFDSCYGVNSFVSASSPSSISLSISPNPTSGDVSIFIEGAPSADVEIFDVLGREVDRFSMNGSYEWETDVLPAGTYIIHASTGSQMISKRIIKQ